MSVDADTIVVRLTVSISLDQFLHLRLGRDAGLGEVVYRHDLVVVVACGGVQRFHGAGEFHGIAGDEVVLDIEVVTPGLPIDEDMI